MSKMIKKCGAIVIIFALLIIFSSPVQAVVDTTIYKPSLPTASETTKATDVAANILGLVRNIGIIISVIVVAVIGVKYMLGSLDEKASYKENMVLYISGCALLLGCTVIPNMIYDMVVETSTTTGANGGGGTALSHEVSFIVDGEVIQMQTVAHGQKPELPPTPQLEGYTFVGWEINPDKEIVEDSVFWAVFTPKEYKITFNPNGGTWASGGTGNKEITVGYNAEFSVPEEATKSGYVFAGWTLNGLNVGTEMEEMRGNETERTYVASWVGNNQTYYTVKEFVMNTGYTYDMREYKVAAQAGENVTISPNIEEGFELVEANSTLSGTVKEDSSLCLEVYLDRKKYTITIIDDGEEKTEIYLYGSMLVGWFHEKEGYRHVGYSPELPATMPAEDITVTVTYAPLER